MYKLPAWKLKELFLQGSISASEIVTYFLKRIKKIDPQINAMLSVFEEKAIQQANEIDKKRKEKKPLGNLAGIPLLLKDNMHYKGEITSCGSKFLSNYKAPFHATVTKHFLNEDAIILGKTNLDEFAMGSSTEKSAFFPTKNPWNLSCVPGGSSGGSAAAVAARFSPLATGSDTGGSIRQPASLCGIVGFKPTYGRVSRYGLVAFGSSLDQIGPLTTNIKDAALMMEVMGRPCEKDSTCLSLPKENILETLTPSLKGVTIGVPYDFLKNVKNQEVTKNFDSSLEILKKLGAEIINVDLSILEHGIAVYYILAPAEASTNLARFDGIRFGVRSKNAKTLEEVYDLSRSEGFGSEVKKRIMLGTYVLSAGVQNSYYKKAQNIRGLIIKHFNKAFEKCDAILTPTSPTPAFPIGGIQDPIEMYLQDLFTVSANLAGIPSLSIPSGFDKEGKPLGIQLMGPALHDIPLLKYGYAFEQATMYNEKIPVLFDKEIL